MASMWIMIAACFVCGCFGSYCAAAKGRGLLEGFIFGGMLGPFGVVAIASLPTLSPRPEEEATPEVDPTYETVTIDPGKW
jgi:hypothetical protein